MTVGQSGRVQPQHYRGLCSDPVVEFELVDEEATRRLGRWLADEATDGDFIGLVGDLGAGKTTLVQGLVAGVDTTGRWEATSPTYALVQIYETEPVIVHIDLYRLEGWSDLESIGYWDYVDAPSGITCVEWLDRIPGAWPERGIVVELMRGPTSRKLRLWADQSWAERARTLDPSKLTPRNDTEAP